jgi:hypothetical protein
LIPRVHKQGSRTIGLLKYLYGPGTHEEHTDPHLVASWDGLAPDPGRQTDATLTELQQLLDEPLHLLASVGRRPDRHVWHLSIRTAPTDRILSDAEWADIARRTVAATGIDPADGAGCRWVAVRHADDHIHIAATLVREDGRKPDHHRSGQRAQNECRLIEAEYGLYRISPGDGTAARRPTSAERHKAERRGQGDTSREQLHQHVRRALAGAADESEFFGRLAEQGVRIKKRIAPSGDVLGYSVAMVGDRNRDQEPIWFSGSTLAPDLSLPKIRRRFTESTGADDSLLALGRGGTSAAARARRFAADTIDDARASFTSDEDLTAAAHLTGIGEILYAVGQTTTGTTGHELRKAAGSFERGTRSHIRAADAEMSQLRRAARQIAHSGHVLGRGPDGVASAVLLDVLIFAVLAAARWHNARQHAQQADAARRTAEQLRAAYRATTTASLTVLCTHGEQLPGPAQRRYADMISRILPDLTDRIQAEPGSPALMAVLAQAEQAGHDAPALLVKAATFRELGTADSISDVLIWRLHHLADAAPPTCTKTTAWRSRPDAESVPAATVQQADVLRPRRR